MAAPTKKPRLLSYMMLALLFALFIPYAAMPFASDFLFVEKKGAAATEEPPSSFHYRFSVNGILNETGSPAESTSPYFWLNSGGRLTIEAGVGQTIQGAASGVWQSLYALTSALDTGNGNYPQNLFRLLTKSSWHNVDQKIRFSLRKFNMTETPNRDSYSGVLLMSRHTDGNNLYYAGVRMDGTAIIKKKVNGTYYTLGSAPVFAAEGGFDRDTNPNLIPGKRWMGLRSIVADQSDGSVKISLYLDKNDSGSWQLLLERIDRDGFLGAEALKSRGVSGIRTDYFDVYFDDYRLTEL